MFVIAMALTAATSAVSYGHAENYANYAEGHGHDNDYHHVEHHEPANYKFGYAVKDPHTGDHKEAWEARDGDVVKGSYSLYEPDGTHRVVDYTSDKHNGFSATVKRTGGHHNLHEIDHWGH